MQETIIVSNLNQRELLKSLAINGKNTFNIRVFKPIDLAKEALLRSGKFISQKEISTIKQECIIYTLARKTAYFEHSSFRDAQNINVALNYARKLCRGNEETKLNGVFNDGEFKEKNQALLEVYRQYKAYLKANELTDSLAIINFAIKDAKPFNAEFIVFEETPLEPLEEELLKVVSDNNYVKETISEFAGKQNSELKDVTYVNAYGSVNEVEYLLGYIAKNKLHYDDCLICLLDSSYVKHLLNYRDSYDLPITFASGQDLSLSNSFKVLCLLDRWNKEYNATDSLNNLIDAPVFNTTKFWGNISANKLANKTKSEIIKTVGNLKLSVYPNDKLSNYSATISAKKELECYPYVEKFAQELTKGYSYLIKTYTNIDNEILETKAINTICTYLDEYFTNLPDKDVEVDLPQQLTEIIDSLAKQKIITEVAKPGFLHVTDLNNALACVRKHLFICGLNAKSFPGSPKENYLLLDSDLERFGEVEVKDSNNTIQINKKCLMAVVKNATSFGSKLHLSYSGYNLAELKQENPSSMLFELFKKERGEKATTKDLTKALGEQQHYFAENISSLTKIGNEYLRGHLISETIDEEEDEKATTKLNYTISPSGADIFFACPKRFYLTKILGISEPEEDNPFKTLPANDEGTLIHECMEDYGNHPTWEETDFLANAEKKFNDYFKKRIPLHSKELASLKKEYLRMAKIAYTNDPNDKEVVASEQRIGPYHDPITGLSFGGIVDRIEKTNDGKYRIVDYKTYKDKRNTEYDIDSCFQVVLYAYILENSGTEKKEIEDCEYRYLRNPMTVKVGYHYLKDALKDKLKEIKKALDSGDFPCTSNPKEACKYCHLKDICGIDKEDRDDE